MTVDIPLPRRRLPLGYLWFLIVVIGTVIHHKMNVLVSDLEWELFFESLVLVFIYKRTIWVREADRRDGWTFWRVDETGHVVPAENGFYHWQKHQVFALRREMTIVGRAFNYSHDLVAVYRYTLVFEQEPGPEEAQAFHDWRLAVSDPDQDPPRPFRLTTKQFWYYTPW